MKNNRKNGRFPCSGNQKTAKTVTPPYISCTFSPFCATTTRRFSAQISTFVQLNLLKRTLPRVEISSLFFYNFSDEQAKKSSCFFCQFANIWGNYLHLDLIVGEALRALRKGSMCRCKAWKLRLLPAGGRWLTTTTTVVAPIC